uniref:Ethylene-responsive transcription factor-like protein At4g13040 n=1 Tax=Cucumis melo TaxID=3656 RepID=A0A9I9E527_CUCME
MVSLRRRRLLGLCSGKSSFVAPLPKFSDHETAPENPSPSNKLITLHPKSSDDVNIKDRSSIVNMESSFTNALEWTSLSEQSNQPISGCLIKNRVYRNHSLVIELQIDLIVVPCNQLHGYPLKHRKRHRRKNSHNQELSIMRGVYFKNMKWQAAIKVDKKQIHLGTFGSQEEAAHLYDRLRPRYDFCRNDHHRAPIPGWLENVLTVIQVSTNLAAFVCGREPNFELSDEEKQELQKFKWEDFLAMTRHAITNKKHKRLSVNAGTSPKKLEASSLQIENTELKHRFNESPLPEDINFT